MARKIFVWMLIIVFLASTSGCASYMKCPDFKERHQHIQHIAVVAPDIEVYRLTFKGDQEMLYELIPLVRQYSQDEFEITLKKKGYDVEKLDLSKEALEKDPELKSALFNIRQAYNKKLQDIQRRKKRQFTYSLGSDVNLFADLGSADTLLFVKGTGYKKSGGEIAKDIVKSVLLSAVSLGNVMMLPSFNVAIFKVAFVDGDTGEILWFNHNTNNANINVEKEKRVRSAMRSLLKPFPDSVNKLKK